MKTITKISAIVILFLTSSCFLEGVTGDRNVVSQSRNISSDFDAISASQGLDVYLKMGDDISVEVEADENLLDIIVTEVEDGVLRIYSDKNIRSAKSRKIYVTAKSLTSLRVTSAAAIISENTINSDELELKATSAANLNLKLNVNTLSCNSTSAAEIKLEGSANNFTVKSTSAAEVRAKNLETKVCDASVTSAANVSVTVSEELDANATSAGSIRYYGTPKKIKKKSTSAGSISG